MIDSHQLVRAALAAGFDAAGVCAADLPGEDADALQRWIDSNHHAGLHHVADTALQRRGGAGTLLDGCRSVLVVACSYHQPELTLPARGRIARYALGKDYHGAIRRRLSALMSRARGNPRQLDYRLCVDSTPLLERAYARRAGLGFVGHNSMLISPRLGSYTLLGAALLDVELAPLPAFPGVARVRCGRCTACVQACPTGAIVAPGVVDARRCLSYWTIEHRGHFDATTPPLHGWLFGCDRCQEVCPFNRKARGASDPRLCARSAMQQLTPRALVAGDDDEIARQIAGTPLRRAGVAGLRRNARRLLDDTTQLQNISS